MRGKMSWFKRKKYDMIMPTPTYGQIRATEGPEAVNQLIVKRRLKGEAHWDVLVEYLYSSKTILFYDIPYDTERYEYQFSTTIGNPK